MRTASENATALHAVTSPREREATTAEIAYGRILRFSVYHAASEPHRQTRFRESAMLAKIRQLEPEQLSKLGSIIDGMIEEKRARHNRAFIDALSALSNESLNRIWDNPKDAEYDEL